MSFVQDLAVQSMLRKKSDNPQLELECRRKIELRTYHLLIDLLSSKKLTEESSLSTVTIRNGCRRIQSSEKTYFEQKSQLEKRFINGWKWVLSSEIFLPTMPMCFRDPPSSHFSSDVKRIRVRNSYWDTQDVRIDVTKIITDTFLQKWEPQYEVEIEINRINADSIARVNRALKTIESLFPIENVLHGPVSRYIQLLHHPLMRPVVYPKLFVGMMPRTLNGKHEPPNTDPWWISRKCNGERVLIYKDGDGCCYEVPRHGFMFRCSKNINQHLSPLPSGSIIDAERLLSDECIILDVLVYGGKNLVSLTKDFQERLSYLKSLSPPLHIQSFVRFTHSISHSLPYEWSLEDPNTSQYDGYILTQQSYPFQYGATSNYILKSKVLHTVDLLIVKTDSLPSLHFLSCWSLYAQGLNGLLSLQTKIYLDASVSAAYSSYAIVEFAVEFDKQDDESGLFIYTPILTRKDKHKPNFIDTVFEIQRSVVEEESKTYIE